MAKRVNEDGQIWAVPVGESGFCPAVVARSADPSDPVGFSLIYVRPAPTDLPPNPDDLPPLSEWGQAWVGLMSRRPFSTNRWTCVGSVKEFEPLEWPMPPWQELQPPNENDTGGWSVATTGDRPSLTVLTNDSEPRAVAEQFPSWNILTAPSKLEKSLDKYLRSKPFDFYDLHFEPTTVNRESVQRWHNYGTTVRGREHVAEPDALPAGRKTDRSLAGGEWLGFPARGGGFSVGLFLPRPPKHFRIFSDGLVMVFDRVWPAWPTLAEVQELSIENATAVGQTSMICVRDGRWRVLGRDTPFDVERWPLPTPWRFDDTAGSVAVLRTPEGEVAIPVDREVVNTDPVAGSFWAGSSSPYSFYETFASGYATEYMRESSKVTPQRAAVWRHVNEQIESELGTTILDHWQGNAAD